MIVQPQHMTLYEWADRFADLASKYGPVVRLKDDDWQKWGAQLLMNPSLADIPNPYQFDDWREWAEYSCEVL